MAIEDNTTYGIRGDQIKDLAEKVRTAGGGGGGEVKTLTEADFNWPEDNPNSVALWKLPMGFYQCGANITVLPCSDSMTAGIMTNQWVYYSRTYIVGANYSNNRKTVTSIFDGLQFTSGLVYPPTTTHVVNVLTGLSNNAYYASLSRSDITNNLTTPYSTTGKALDARQGKILDDKITALEERVKALEDK